MRSPIRHLAIPVLLATLFVVAACGASTSGQTLTGKSWIWASASGDSPGELKEIPNPERYTIEFKTDGTFSAKADCNQVNGQYTSTDNGDMTITLGPSTLVACPANSLADDFVTGLSGVTAWDITDRQLALTTTDGRTMTLD